MPHVLVLAHELNSFGGMQAYVGDFVAAARTEHDVRTVTRDQTTSSLVDETVHRAKGRGLLEQSLAAASRRADMVVADQVQTAAAAACVPRGFARACFIHAAELTGGRWHGAKRWVLRRQDRIWGPSRWVCDYVVDEMGVGSEIVRVLPPAVDCDTFGPVDDERRCAIRLGLGLDPQRPVVVTAARLSRRAQYKGVDLAIEACQLMRDLEPQLVVIGAGDDLPRLRALAGNGPRFLGNVQRRELAATLAAADVFCMPSHAAPFGRGSRMEGFGIVFLEAAASGVPSVRGTAPGTAEAVVHGRTGTVADPDPEAVAVELRRWLDAMVIDRRSISVACREWALKHRPSVFRQRVVAELANL